MRTEKINGNRIVLFDSIDNLPMGRFEEFNRFFMIDAGIGSDVESIDAHITRIRVFNGQGKTDDVEKALLNLRQNMIFAIKNVSPAVNCFYSLIDEINGRKVRATSLEDVERLKSELDKTGITINKVRGLISSLKKKLIARLSYFTRRKQIAHS